MNTITLEIPEILSEFDESTRQELVLGALRKITKDKLIEEINQREEAFDKVQKFKKNMDVNSPNLSKIYPRMPIINYMRIGFNGHSGKTFFKRLKKT